MIHYTVFVKVPEGLSDEFEEYMRRKHIPEVMATAMFVSAEFARSDEGGFRTTYTAEDRTALDEYIENEADRLRTAFAEEFPHSVSVRREIWGSIETWIADQT